MAKSIGTVEVEITNKVKAIYECTVCGRMFPLIEEEHYIAREQEIKGISTIVKSEEPELYDAFDCPHCGCQNVVQVRKRRWDPCPCEYGCCEDCEETEEEEEEE